MTLRTGLLLVACALGGCGHYVLQGKVLSGPTPGVSVVDADDERLQARGLDRATYELTLDPRSLNRKVLARGIVAPDGSFSIPIREPGAGILEYDFELLVRHEGHGSAVWGFRLPPRGKALFVTLAPGPDRYQPREDPYREAETYMHN